MNLSWGKFSPFFFFCLEFLCFLGKAIRKLVRKATVVASRILRFPWLNSSGFSPKYSRQAALLALIDYIFQMIDQGTVMYTHHFWSHFTLDSVAFWIVVTVWFVPIVMDCLFIICLLLKVLLKQLIEIDFWTGSGIWCCQLLTGLQLGGKLTHCYDLQTCLQWQVGSRTVGSTTLFHFTVCGKEKKRNPKPKLHLLFGHIFCIYFVYSAILKCKQTVF